MRRPLTSLSPTINSERACAAAKTSILDVHNSIVTVVSHLERARTSRRALPASLASTELEKSDNTTRTVPLHDADARASRRSRTMSTAPCVRVAPSRARAHRSSAPARARRGRTMDVFEHRTRAASTHREDASTSASSSSFDDDELAYDHDHPTSTSLVSARGAGTSRSFWRDGDARQVEAPAGVVEKVRAWDSRVQSLSEDELRAKTDEFRARLRAGETLDDILVEAFAVVREASARVGTATLRRAIDRWSAVARGLGGGDANGRGKTLVATLPAYLNALEGKGVHVVTVDDYLAARDATEMGRIYRYLGLTVGVIQSDMDSDERKRAYACDITYVTNTEIGFDYLRDNMARTPEELVVLNDPFNFAIVDEVDSVLIDEGRNPLLITGTGAVNDSDRYVTASKVAENLVEGSDYKVVLKEKTAELTDEGMYRAETMLGVSDLWDAQNPWGKYILLAVKAKSLFIKDIDYIVLLTAKSSSSIRRRAAYR